jgi:serine/threonine-protein kinase
LATVQAGGADRNVVLDRQGRFVVYRGGAGMMSELMVRDLHSLEERVIPGSLGARGPFLSPDGQHVGFSVGGQLRRVPLAGGPAAVITQSGVSRGGTWGSDDRIVFANAEGDTGLRIVSAAGGTAETLTVPDRTNGEADHVFPFMLPGNRAVLFTIQRGRSENASGIPNVVAILDLETRKWKPLITGATRAEYVAPGHLIYATGSSIMAVGFNPNTLAISGQPTLLIESASADFTLADTGTLAFVPVSAYQGVVAVERTLVWVDRSGKEEAIAAPARGYQMARLSPDGTRIAVQVSDGQSDLFVWDIARQALTRITAGASDEQSPLWTPDGARLVWSSNIESNPNLFWQAADGSGSAERMTLAAVAQFPTSISADGKTVVFHEFTGSGSRLRRFALPAFGGAKPTQASAEPLLEARGLFGGELSPDGRWLAYHSSESGQPEVYVRPFPNTDSGRWQVSNNGGTRAGWSRDGRELFYLDGEGLLTVAGVQVDAQTLKLTAPKKLLNARYLPGSTVLGLDLRGYDVSPDGKRFVMIKDTAPETTAAAPLGSISVILNWTEQLRARVPLR